MTEDEKTKEGWEIRKRAIETNAELVKVLNKSTTCYADTMLSLAFALANVAITYKKDHLSKREATEQAGKALLALIEGVAEYEFSEEEDKEKQLKALQSVEDTGVLH